jgi:hypothetical protein
LHEALGFAVAFGLGHTEGAGYVLLCGAALLLAYNHNGLPGEFADAAYYGGVITKEAVTVHFYKVGAELLDVIEGVGAVGVTGNLHTLPGG